MLRFVYLISKLTAKIMILSSLLISSAFAADAATAAPEQSTLMSFLPLIVIFAIFYFLLIRPQQKKMKEHQAMVNALKSGDKVYTSSGIFGVVKSVDAKDNLVEIEIAKDVIVKVLRPSVGEVIRDKKEIEKSSKHSKKSKKS